MNNPLFLNTILLGGNTLDKLDAIRAAGFDGLELWKEDLQAFADDTGGLVAELRSHDLTLTDYQVLRDFDGAPGETRDARRREALAMLDTAVELGAPYVQMPSNTQADVDASRIPEDLAWLDAQAASRGLRVAYEPMAWSTVNHTLPDLWGSIDAARAGHIDVVIDAFHVFARGRPLSDLDGIPATRIANVQLCDFDRVLADHELADTGKHRRMLPGDGNFPLHELVAWLRRVDYRGPIGVEVFNDELKAQRPMASAAMAMAALLRIVT